MTEQPTVGGRYELGELLGRGGMAEVRKGTDTRLGRVVAVKRLRTDLASDATFQARFRREAQSSASLNHPAIVAVYDTGEEPASDGSGVQQPYIVMEYVAGRTLRDILREGRKILPERALEITSGVLSALDYSHRAGIIHRDIKPGNVMLTPSGDVKVMDFGIARAISDAASSMTQTAAVVGTAQYLSPEQARGETVDSRSDVYSAGCLLYELLTGRPPFVGDSPVAVAYQHVREQALPPSDHDTELTPEIDAIVMKSLAKRVEDRYQSAAAMRSDIERYLAGRPVQAQAPAPLPPTTTLPPVAPRPAPMPVPVPVPAQESDDDGPRTGFLLALAALVIGIIVAAIFLWPKLFPSAPEQVQVPDVVRMSENSANAALGDANLTVGTASFEPSGTVPQGRVISQDPPANAFVDPGTTVTLTISAGKPEVAIPDIVNQMRQQAQGTLTDAGLKPRFQVVESDEAAGQVIRTDPAAGTKVASGSTVVVYYSDGPEEVPSVVGLTQYQATQKIIRAGFKPVVRQDPTSTEKKGTVVDQLPEPGTTQPQGSEVNIFVSAFEPTPSASPTPSGQPTPGGPGNGGNPPGQGGTPPGQQQPTP
ncbi:Stk1 family PASTA domain-containing Ser/Thr kinase [Nocardioides sp. TRM66260-LWL]|uniref:Stk1 family PASTA domain-containing Ser/Thr kinase n=1 Tax=Nocardioides sp. TRM66260-LWL TaxID=2874478 RepID=UPI001CC572C2|nr:Stk1 family PASTA domain-containing Ser/Thr kinase [Nocardioides sp. TRM66260-LWL]MBZ5735535.1 Stk1 family PASTA domain-containing Ser/Thr kinase [Nocardioides sp. TRM66260-LWL]